MKKGILAGLATIAVFILIVILVTPLFFTSFSDKQPSTKKECAFCNPEVIANQQYYEGQLVRVLYNYYPMLPGHTLIIPKRQVERFEELTAAEVAEMTSTINKVQKAFEKVYKTSDYFLALQNGKKAGQTVMHVHFHMIPRTSASYIDKVKIWLHFLGRPFYEKPLTKEELMKINKPLHEAMIENSPEFNQT